jgi:4-amino-4-deoxy-L-arabinose transferase-like glycosyltransferase
MRFIGPALLFAAVLAVYGLLRTRLGAPGALVGAYAFGLYLPSYEGVLWLHKEPAALLLASACLLFTARYIASGRRAHLALAGLSLGGLAMVRLEYGWLILALLGLALVWWALASQRTAARRSACILVVAFATCLPWLAYTHAVTGRLLYWGNSGGSSLYWMSPTGGRGETGQWHSWRTMSRDPALAGYRPFFAELKPLTPLERDSAFQRAALRNIRARPLLYLRNIGANVERMWFLHSFRPRPATSLCVIYAVLNSLLLAAAAWAAVILIRRRRALPSETLPIAAFAVGTFAVHVFTSAEPRLMLPAIPALFILIGHAMRLQREPRPRVVV